MDNLTEAEKRWLKSLKKELIICQTDKSGCFSILSWDRYIQARKMHTQTDKKISLEESEEIHGTLTYEIVVGKLESWW